jgi:hypothetical protein
MGFACPLVRPHGDTGPTGLDSTREEAERKRKERTEGKDCATKYDKSNSQHQSATLQDTSASAVVDSWAQAISKPTARGGFVRGAVTARPPVLSARDEPCASARLPSPLSPVPLSAWIGPVRSLDTGWVNFASLDWCMYSRERAPQRQRQQRKEGRTRGWRGAQG